MKGEIKYCVKTNNRERLESVSVGQGGGTLRRSEKGEGKGQDERRKVRHKIDKREEEGER